MSGGNGQTTALAKAHETAQRVGHLLNQRRKTLEDIVPRHMTSDRMARIALAAINRPGPGKYSLADCTPESIVEGVITAVGLGLDINDGTGRAWLIPRFDKHTGNVLATFQIGYPGLEELAYRSGMVETLYAYPVFDGDEFRFSLGLNPDLHHVPKGETDAAKLTHVYAVVKLKGGGYLFEVMTRAQVDAIRDRSKARGGPWQTDYPEQARKTAIRRICKHVPKSAELQRAVRVDQISEYGPIVGDADEITAPSKVDDLKARLRDHARALPPKTVDGDVIDPETGEVLNEPAEDSVIDGTAEPADREPGDDGEAYSEDDFVGK